MKLSRDKKTISASFSEEKARLFEEILESGSALRIRVTGGSMAPFLRADEIVTIRRVPPSELRRGDLLFFRNAYGGCVLHRIVRKRRDGDGVLTFRTKGDALLSFDPPLRADQVLGKVCRIEKKRSARTMDMDSYLQRKANTLIAAAEFMRAGAYRTFTALVGIARAAL